MVTVTRRATFSASHRLYNPELSEAENIELFDKCSNLHGHGHNYVLEVTVAGRPSAKTGYVIDTKKLKEIINREVIAKVDHKHLNVDVEFLRGVIPSAENIAQAIWDKLEPAITEGKLYRIRLHETENNVVEILGRSA